MSAEATIDAYVSETLTTAAKGADCNDGPPTNALTVALADDDAPRDSLLKKLAAGQVYSEKEIGLLLEIEEAISQANTSQISLDDALFVIGRNAHILSEEFDWTLKQMGELLDYSESRLSQFRSTYLAFPTPESRLGQTFSLCEQARATHTRLAKSEQVQVSPTDVLRKIAAEGLSVREASAFFQRQAVQRAKDEAECKYVQALEANPALAGRAFNEDCLTVLRRLDPKSVKLIFADPPYAEFKKVGHAGYVSGKEATNGLRIDCDNNYAEAAIPLSCELFAAARDAIRDDGALVYWSAGLHADRPEIILAAREAGWECRFAGFWQKHLIQPGNFSWPWSTGIERFLVFYPKGAEPFDHSQALSRSDVITQNDLDLLATFKSPSQMASSDFKAGRKVPGDVHMFQKPLDLCRFFLEKLTYPGDLVVDPFGCSGEFCIAAEQSNRPWIYIELNPLNYKWGVGRISEAMNASAMTPPDPDVQPEILDDLPF